jgi:hypothetical protein
VNFYGTVRATQDIDFLIDPSKANAEQMTLTLAEFGFADAEELARIHQERGPDRDEKLGPATGL